MSKQSAPIRTLQETITGTARIQALANYFLTRSQWFAVDPLPDDNWQFTYKKEAGLILDGFYALDGFHAEHPPRPQFKCEYCWHIGVYADFVVKAESGDWRLRCPAEKCALRDQITGLDLQAWETKMDVDETASPVVVTPPRILDALEAACYRIEDEIASAQGAFTRMSCDVWVRPVGEEAWLRYTAIIAYTPVIRQVVSR